MRMVETHQRVFADLKSHDRRGRTGGQKGTATAAGFPLWSSATTPAALS